MALFPGDELLGRLRRLASVSGNGTSELQTEIYDRLANVDLLIIDAIDAAARKARYPEPRRNEVDEDQLDDKSTYEPGLADSDIGRLSEIMDQRMMNERATVVTTTSDLNSMRKSFVRAPNEPSYEIAHGGTQFNRLSSGPMTREEFDRREMNFSRLVSRMLRTCGRPVVTEKRLANVANMASDQMAMLNK